MKHKIQNKYHKNLLGFMSVKDSGDWCKVQEAENLLLKYDIKNFLLEKNKNRLSEMLRNAAFYNTILIIVCFVEFFLLFYWALYEFFI
jgi:hypothetical protein